MGASASAPSGGGGDPADDEPLPKKAFLKVKIVSARGLRPAICSQGLYVVCKIPGKTTNFQTRTISSASDPLWQHFSDTIEECQLGDALLFSLHSRANEDEESPLGSAQLGSNEFLRRGFSGELPLTGFGLDPVTLRVKVVVGTNPAVGDHTTRAQVLDQALSGINTRGLDSVDELDRDTYLAKNKELAKDLKQALKAEGVASLKSAYADFKDAVTQARQARENPDGDAMPPIVEEGSIPLTQLEEERADTLIRKLSPAAKVVGVGSTANLLSQFVCLLPEEPQRHGLYQAMQGLKGEEQELSSAAEGLRSAAEQAGGEDDGGIPPAALAAGAGVAVVGAGAAAMAMRDDSPEAAPEASPSRNVGPRANLLYMALQEVEGEKLDEADGLTKVEYLHRNMGLKTGMRTIFGTDRYAVFKRHYSKFEDGIRDIRPTDSEQMQEEKRTDAARALAERSRDMFGQAADTAGEDQVAPLFGQMVQLVQDPPARHTLHRELQELYRQEAGLASPSRAPEEEDRGVLAIPSQEVEEEIKDSPPPQQGGGGPTAGQVAAGAGAVGIGAALTAWWMSKFNNKNEMGNSEANLASDPGQVHVADAMGSLGTAYRNAGKLDEALAQQKKALTMKQKALGPDHAELATSYNNVAAVHRLKGNLPEAFQNYKKALEIRRRTLGDSHPDTAASHTNVGAVLLQQGALDDALEQYSRALEITRAVYGDQHPETAARYQDVGAAFEQKGTNDDLVKALEHLWNALNIQAEALGDLNPGVGDCYNNVGAVLFQLQRYDESYDFHHRALDIRLATLGEEHSDTALSYGNVGVILEQQGKLDEAFRYQTQALNIRRAVLGENHSETAASRVNVGVVLERQSKYREAMDQFKEASIGLVATMGPSHPWSKACDQHLKRCQRALGGPPGPPGPNGTINGTR